MNKELLDMGAIQPGLHQDGDQLPTAADKRTHQAPGSALHWWIGSVKHAQGYPSCNGCAGGIICIPLRFE